MSENKKSSGLATLRQITRSVFGGVPYGDDVEDKLARIISGASSQIMTLDPETGEPYLGGWQKLKEAWNGVPRSQGRKGVPGIVNEALSLPALLALIGKEDYIPQVSLEAADQADKMHTAVRESMDLPEAKGMAQNAADSAGVMLGQLPLPLARLKALRAGKPLVKGFGKVVTSPLEWFSPSVDPSLANYAAGAGFGAATGAYSDYQENKTKEANDNEEFSQAVRDLANRYTKTGTVALAEGGKVGALRKALDMIAMKPQTIKTGEKRSIDPIENLRQVTKATLNPDEVARVHDWIDTQKDLPEMSEENVDRLLDLHSRIMNAPNEEIPMKKAEGGKVSELSKVVKTLRNDGIPGYSDYVDHFLKTDPSDNQIEEIASKFKKSPDRVRKYLSERRAYTSKYDSLSDLRSLETDN